MGGIRERIEKKIIEKETELKKEEAGKRWNARGAARAAERHRETMKKKDQATKLLLEYFIKTFKGVKADLEKEGKANMIIPEFQDLSSQKLEDLYKEEILGTYNGSYRRWRTWSRAR